MLKDLVKGQMKGGYIVPLLAESALLAGKRDTMKRRRDCFHPSEISGENFCSRAWLLGVKDPILYLEQKNTAQRQWRLDVGTTVHALVQERLGETGKLFGFWRCERWCLEERCLHYGFRPTCSLCPNGTPKKEKWVYQELSVDNDDVEIHGHTDGLMVLTIGKYVFEFKTANSSTFSVLAEPLDEHKEQAMIYVDSLQRKSAAIEKMLVKMLEEGSDVSDVLAVERQPIKGAIIVYMNKDSQEFKEFLVKADEKLRFPSSIRIRGMEEIETDWLDEKKAMLVQTLEWKKAGVLPDRLDVCTSASCSRARRCFASRACFAEKKGEK